MADQSLYVEFAAELTARDFLPYSMYVNNNVADGRVQLERLPFIQSTNVLTYGAVADDSTDNTTDIHAARDAAGVGGIVYFPFIDTGIYRVAGLVANVADQTWILAPGVKIFMITGSNTQILNISVADGITIDGGVWDHNKAGGQNGEQGITIENRSNITLKDLTIQNADLWGISVFDSDYIKAYNCTILDSTDIAFFISSSDVTDHTGHRIKGLSIDRSSMAVGSSGGGLQVRAEAGHVITDMLIEDVVSKMPAGAIDMIPVEIWDLDGSKTSNITTIGGSIGFSTDRNQDCTFMNTYAEDANDYNLESVQNIHCKFIGGNVDGKSRATAEGMSGSLVNDHVAVIGITFRAFTDAGIHWQGNSLYIGVVDCDFENAVTDAPHILLEDTDYFLLSGNQHESDGVANHRCVELAFTNYGKVDDCVFKDWDGAGAPILFYGSDAVVYDLMGFNGNIMNPIGELFTESYSGSATMGNHIKAIGNVGFERSGFAIDVLDHNNNVIRALGAVTPASTLTAGIGSEAMNRAGSADSQKFFKETGTGNTGWTALVVN